MVFVSTVTGAQDRRTFDYFYIEAGEGDSSGGHAAIRFGNTVYHYQYRDGNLRAVKESSREFDFKYRFLGNRSIHVSSIAVSEAVYQRIRDYFNQKYSTQARQFDILEQINADNILVRKLIEASATKNSKPDIPIPVQGAALFSPSVASAGAARQHPETVSLQLLADIKRAYGRTYIADRIRRIKSSIRGLRVSAWSSRDLLVSENRYPIGRYSLAQRYTDLVTNLSALQVLRAAVPLKRSAVLPSLLGEFNLNSRQVGALVAYRERLQRDLVELIASNRPDWGYPFMLGLARLMVLDESVQRRRLVLLDTFRQRPELIDPKETQRYWKVFNNLLDLARSQLNMQMRRLPRIAVDESEYSQLELLGNRYVELARGVIGGKVMRVHDNDLTPVVVGELRVSDFPRINKSALVREGYRLDRLEKQYSQQLQQHYGYHLLARNCVSEIFRNIQLALAIPSETGRNQYASNAASIHSLGGRVDPAWWNSVPFIASAQVRNQFRVQSTRRLPSFRQNQIGRLYADQNPFVVFMRESNTLTSTVYRRNSADSTFLFFTDDRVMPRPVFGAVNTVVGLGQALGGLFIWPVDQGEWLIRGLKGVLVSLPELAFFNVRKGSYKYLPEPKIEGDVRAVRQLYVGVSGYADWFERR